jgi:hypothetical protein
MGISKTKYVVSVPLSGSELPTENKSVIWEATSGSFALGDTPGGGSGLTTCSYDFTANGGNVSIYIDNVDTTGPSEDGGHTCIKGELTGKVKGGSRWQIARVIVGFHDAGSRTVVKEDARYPDGKSIYNINSFSTTFSNETTAKISFTQYDVGNPGATFNVDYCFNYVLF